MASVMKHLSRKEYNLAIFYVGELIESAYVLFLSKKYVSSSIILSSVFDEISKIKKWQIEIYGGSSVEEQRINLVKSTKKHDTLLGLNSSVAKRLALIISDNSVKDIFHRYALGVNFDKEILTLNRDKDGLNSPLDKFDIIFTAEYFITVISVFSNEFWGVTSESSVICDSIDSLYKEVELWLKSARDNG
ncbi:AbiV family abortive infection protein [Vibrio sp. F13]|uniref:AbiV family abortive infection protein n=1 Tax=Vibrio sp. F13 TaxID=2070777 RepID=UPI0039B69C7A